MKSLVIQLARLGDIYQSWPALRALKRRQPAGEIHLLTRPRFAGACEGLTAVDRVHLLPTQQILQPLVSSSISGIEESLEKLRELTSALRSENFDQIVNLSFSPLSSYLVHQIETNGTKIKGYTRFSDGYLRIPDDMSAYFYAQVGPGRPNRFHLCEIFATLLGVDLSPPDWQAPQLPAIDHLGLPGEFVAVHVGASESHKRVTYSKWINILSHLRKLRPVKIALIGGSDEVAIGEQMAAAVPAGELTNLVGRLDLLQTMAVLQRASLLVGPDSAPLHMASLVGVPSLNLSVGELNFWETGPRSPGSVVLPAASEEDLPSDTVADMVARLLQHQRLPFATIQACPGTPSYTGLSRQVGALGTSATQVGAVTDEFAWQLLKAIYQGDPFPPPPDKWFLEGICQLIDVNSFVIETLQAVHEPKDLQTRAGLLDRGEEIIETVAKLVPSLIPAIRWYKTEKVRLGPLPFIELRDRNLAIQKMFQDFLEVYVQPTDFQPSVTKEAP
ncbi:MAG: hypothetical protein C5B49_12670 [Bdellovibrio sp.]|nr:MAG: hypothetical protein C5B49_12670 [Bdellovibrio sp.]